MSRENMFQNFCTRVARKLRRLGFTRKAAARISHCFYVCMITMCGLMGLFFIIPWVLYEQIAIVGRMHADARYGLFSSANFALCR